MSEVDSEFQAYKEEFEQKEVEYRDTISKLKKDVQYVRESVSKSSLSHSRERLNSKQNLYASLDDASREQV